jgi:pimeloyl-ACP methyl ester carboxylesterase
VTSVTNETLKVGGTELAVVRGGTGKPLLILHDELGYPGWMTWNERLAQERTLLIPLQPGFGQTPRIDWIMNYRDLAGFYSQALRDERLDPLDVIGFSAGGFIAAEMIAADPKIFNHMILAAPMGLKPAEGEIFDFFALTIGRHLRSTVADPAGTPEFAKIYGGEMTPAQFEAFEDARAETARLGWEPYLHNPSLSHLLAGAKPPTLIIRGTNDKIVPQGCVEAYLKAISGSKAAKIDGVGHRPEIENPAEFERLVKQFLAA